MKTKFRVLASLALTAAIAIGVAAILSGSSSVSAAPHGGGQFCGGIAGIPCPEGFVCVDDPRDNCNPKTGGADCGGICRRAR